MNHIYDTPCPSRVRFTGVEHVCRCGIGNELRETIEALPVHLWASTDDETREPVTYLERTTVLEILGRVLNGR